MTNKCNSTHYNIYTTKFNAGFYSIQTHKNCTESTDFDDMVQVCMFMMSKISRVPILMFKN